MEHPKRILQGAFNSEVFRVQDAYIAELANILSQAAQDLREMAKQEPLARVQTRFVNEVNEITPVNSEKKNAFLRFRITVRE